MSEVKIWTPEVFLNCDKINSENKYAVIVLNRPINVEKNLVECLWNHASFRIAVDGGANRWLDWLQNNNLEDELMQPNLITGDLDSCHKQSISFFNKSRVIQTIDQDETDFTKSLHVLHPFVQEMNLENIVALCDTSGRIDQILANINSLIKNDQKPQEISRPVFILSANSLSWLLSTGHHQIHIPGIVKKLWCSLVPFEPTVVTTTGLKWNLTNHTMNFGGIVSTSNKYDAGSSIVKIETDRPILWSMGISEIDD